MTEPKIQLKSGDEVDAVCHKGDLYFRPGERKYVKTKINRRGRRGARLALRSGRYDG